MNSHDSDRQAEVVAAIVVILVVIVVGSTLVIGASTITRRTAAITATTAAAKPAVTASNKTQSILPAMATPVAPVPAPYASDTASVEIDSGAVRFYFASGSAALAPGATQALKNLIAATRLGGKLSISGFHDLAGDQAQNRELALQRALAVSDILKAEGVPGSQIVLNKPVQMQGSGSMADARRVEVTLH